MAAVLAVLVVFLQTTRPMPIVDLFSPEELSQPSLEKRPYTDDDPDTVQLHAGLTEQEEVELVMN